MNIWKTFLTKFDKSAQSRRTLHTHTHTGKFCKIFCTIFVGCFFVTSVFCKECTLGFKDGTVIEHVKEGQWYLSDGSVFIKLVNDHYAEDKQIQDLVSVNGESVNVDINAETTAYINFNCNKYTNGGYFAYFCKYGYDDGDTIGDGDLKDKCRTLTGGCTLGFKDGTVIEHVKEGKWYLSDGSVFIKLVNGHFAEDKQIQDLVSVNGESVNVDINAETTAYINFNCNKYTNGGYFAYFCKYGYDDGDTIGDGDLDGDLKDKCEQSNKVADEEDEDVADEEDEDVADEEDEDVEEAKLVLEKFFSNAKQNASVWKTADGKFNSARLASDLTAGVVLGTVGGVLSANLIKKNQIKKGYEVLHCTIGKQTVAGWGDEFTVGLRR